MGTFPTTPVPAYFAAVYWMGVAGAMPTPCGVWYNGAAVSIRLSGASSATSYTVEWWNPNTGGFDVVSTGVLTGLETSFSVATPGGGWKYGWYRIRGDGPTVDAVFGTTCFTSSFAQVPSSPNFQAIPIGAGQEFPDFANAPVPKGCMGVGTTRAQIENAADPNANDDNHHFTLRLLESQAGSFTNYWTLAPVVDPARPRFLWVQFPNGIAGVGNVDSVPITAVGSDPGGDYYVWCYCKDGTLDGSKVFVEVTGSSGTSCTVKVYYPTSGGGDLKETWNVTSAANAQSQINAGSNYIRAFLNPQLNGGPNPINQGPTAVGNAYFNGVQSCVAALYPLGFTRFEGPKNEPDAQGDPNWSALAHQMMLFQAEVHAGNASAKATGPDLLQTAGMKFFLAAGGGAYLDEVTTHVYDVFQASDLSVPRLQIATFVQALQNYGYGGLRRWITEGNDVYTAQSKNPNLNYGIDVRRQGRLATQQTLLWEEGGIPRETNPLWYDVQHAFWGIPSFFFTVYGGPMPQVPMLYTLAVQTWGQTYRGNYTLPAPADRFLIAQRYSDGSASTMVLQLSCWMASSTITLGVGGATSLTVVDGFGNSSTVLVGGGQATINLSDTPTYVHLPAGVTANVVTVNGWSTSEKMLLDSTRSCTISGVGTTLTPVDGGYLSDISATGAGPWQNTLIWAVNKSVNRALVFAGCPDSTAIGPPLTFTIDVSTNGGSTWTTKATVDVSASATSVLMGADSTDTGTQLDTGWTQQCVFDVPLTGGPLTINGIRVNCSAASYGAAPDSTAQTATNLGGTPTLTMKQLVLRG